MPDLWKVVTIGDGSPDLREQLAITCKVRGSGNGMLNKLPLHSTPTEVKLGLRSVKDLVEGSSDLRILRHYGRLGLGDLLHELHKEHSALPAEVGPKLRLQYLDQPAGERIYIDMKPFIGSDYRVGIFSVESIRTPKGDVLELWGQDGCDSTPVPEDAFFAVQID